MKTEEILNNYERIKDLHTELRNHIADLNTIVEEDGAIDITTNVLHQTILRWLINNTDSIEFK